MPIDYQFVELMFKKYSKHLQDVVTSIETLIDGYDKQLEPLQKFEDTKSLSTSKYHSRIKELEAKKAEAYKKLAAICPNIDKMAEQMQELQKLIVEDTK